MLINCLFDGVYCNRAFYFENEDKQTLEEWAQSILSERYSVVKDERNAYQSMQEQAIDMLDSATRIKRQSYLEKEAVEREWTQSMKTNVEALAMLQDMLVIVGVKSLSSTQL